MTELTPELLTQLEQDAEGLAKERDHLRAEIDRLRELGLAACNWLESSSDKAARRFYAARLRVEISKGAP